MHRNKVDGQPAFVLHTYPYRETSLIVEIFSRDFGRVALLARGARLTVLAPIVRDRKGEYRKDLLELRIEQSELIEDASAWQRGAERFAEDDEEIAAYVEAYERDHDAASLPEASGDAIAAEFERYLKRRERDS